MDMEKVNKALELLRAEYTKMNSDMIEDIDKLKRGESIRIHIERPNYISYQAAVEILKTTGFVSANLHQLFEETMLYHFFKFSCNCSIDPYEFFKQTKFDRESFNKQAEEAIELVSAILTIREHLRELYEVMELKKTIVDDDDGCCHVLDMIRHAKEKEIHHRGDKEFIVSTIPLHGGGFKFDPSMCLDDRIFYTDDPCQIISMAHVAKPGIYLIANVPYGKRAELAFYLLFVTTGDAYIVENAKHSYRKQIYRGTSHNSDGEDSWLGKRYEYTYFPIGIVTEFFDARSEDKNIQVVSKEFVFRVLGNISKSRQDEIIWTQAFVDTCIYKFLNTDLIKEVSIAINPKFILKGSSSNLPAVYQKGLPTLASLNLEWSPERASVEELTSAKENERFLKVIPVDKLDIMQFEDGNLTSLKQVEAKLTYEKRKLEADQLEMALKADHKKNHEKVYNKIVKIARDRFSREDFYFYKRAFQNLTYSMKRYRHVFEHEGKPAKGEYIPSTWTEWTGDFTVEKKSILSLPSHRTYKQELVHDILPLPENHTYRDVTHRKCDICKNYRSTMHPELNFQDVQQFIEFFELSEQEIKELPRQFKDYFNQSRTLYSGNSILDDIDPLAEIFNPWWVSGNNSYNDTEPYFVLILHLCGHCFKKLGEKRENKENK